MFEFLVCLLIFALSSNIYMNTPTDGSNNEPDPYQASDNTQALEGGEIDSVSSTYWSNSLRVVYIVLSIWLFVSLGCGILFRDFLDAWLPQVGGAPFGFWMAQQGSILSFLLLLFLYRFLMNRLDKRYGFAEGDRS